MFQNPFLPGPIISMLKFKQDIVAFLLSSILLLTMGSAFGYPANSHYGQIVKDKLYVTIYEHKIASANNADALTLVTDGLKKVGQNEIMITVLNPEKLTYKNVPRSIILFFKTVYDLAKAGKLVRGGGHTRFGAQSILIAPQFRGIIYMRAKPQKGVLAPVGSLVAIPVTAEELDAYNIGGPLRVTSRLSIQANYFPYPYWCDPKRKSVFSESDIAEMKEDLILKSSRMPLGDASITLGPSRYQFNVPWTARERLADILKRLPDKSSIVLWLGLDPNADAALAWSAKESVITLSPDSKSNNVAGSFLMIVPGIEKSEFGQLNDGVVAMLTKEQWKQFQEAAKANRNLSLTDGGNRKFNLIMPMKPKEDIFSHSISRSSRWLERKDSDSDKQLMAKEPAKLILVVLLTNDAIIRQSITADDLSEYIKKLKKAVNEFFSKLGKGSESHDLIVQTHVDPGEKARFKILHRPAGMPDQTIRDLEAQLKKVKPADSMNALDFEILIKVWR